MGQIPKRRKSNLQLQVIPNYNAKKFWGAVENLGLEGSVILDTEHLSIHWYFVEVDVSQSRVDRSL